MSGINTPYRPTFEVIARDAVSAAASWTAVNLSPFRCLRLTGWFIPATDGVSGILRTSTNNGSSYDAGASDYTQILTRTIAGGVTPGAATSTGVVLNTGATTGNAAPEGEWFTIDIHEFNQTRNAYFKMHVGFLDGSTVINEITGVAYRADTVARNGLQFILSGGNIATGFFCLEGLRG